MELTSLQKTTAKRLFQEFGGAVWWRVGTGKTRIAYKYFAMVAKASECPNPLFLVVCRREAFYDWAQEITKCGLDWEFRTIEKVNDIFFSRPSSLQCEGCNPTVLLMSHGMLAKLSLELKDLSSIIYAIAFDEGFLYKNARSNHCIAARRLSAAVNSAVILSGSMMTARNLEDIYGQLAAINKESCLARTLTDFRSKYMFKFHINPESSHHAKFVAARGSARKVARAIRNVSSIHFPKNDERQISEEIRSIPASKQQLEAFQQLREFYELELKGRKIELKNAPSVIIKCQQISDGWIKIPAIGDLDGKSKDPIILAVQSTKLDYLVGRISELVSCGEKVVVWCAFKHSVRQVLHRLQKELSPNSIVPLYGGLDFDIGKWVKYGKVGIATVGSGSSINHFKDCAYAIYYSHSFKWLDMQQSRGRNNRKDSNHSHCYYSYLQTKGSLDSLVYRTVNSSANEERKLIEEGVNAWLDR